MNYIDLRTIKPTFYQQSAHNPTDEQVYLGYLKQGDQFLAQLEGEFGLVYHDLSRQLIFAARDWIGEVPLHYLIRNDTIYFANFISDLVKNVPSYRYEDVVAVNRSEVVEIDTRSGKVTHHLYFNFNQMLLEDSYTDLVATAKTVHDLLFLAVKKRLPSNDQKTGLLLSGGIDSMSIAFVVSQLNPTIPAFTIEVASQQSTDMVRAMAITKQFGLKHRIVTVSKADILGCVEQAVADCEIYHMYNTFCAVGMHKLALILKEEGFSSVFSGEGGNEAFGDYHDWVITDPITGKQVTLQTTAKELEEPIGREAYIWGNLAAEKLGRYNVQLGSGLDKHGGSRMYKPMFKHGVTLLSPYFDKDIMKILANIPVKTLEKIGGKAGFMQLVFAQEIKAGKIPAEFFNVTKIRFQDASENGSGGITETLLANGFDQTKLIELYNQIFKADIKPLPHLKKTILVR